MSDTESPEVTAAEPLTAASIRQLIREELAAAGRSAETATRSGDPLPAFSAPETASSSGKSRSDQLLMRFQLLSNLPRYQGARRAWVFFGLTVYLKAYCVPIGLLCTRRLLWACAACSWAYLYVCINYIYQGHARPS